MAEFIDLTKKQFGRLTVLKRAENRYGRAFWVCKCGCPSGNIVIVDGAKLRNGETKSCGCYQAECRGKASITHGMTGTRLLREWDAMKRRCYNKNYHRYADHGGRGITVCDEWKNDSEAFCKWALENGYQDGLELERVDNDGNYCPENCKWATKREQANNKRSSIRVTIGGREQTLKQWCDEMNVDYKMVWQRVKKLGWDAHTALVTPKYSHK